MQESWQSDRPVAEGISHFCLAVLMVQEISLGLQESWQSDRPVAEGISHFCLARNLIRPLGSTHNFTQSGWLILFIPEHLSGQHKLGKSRQTPLFDWTTSFSADVSLPALQWQQQQHGYNEGSRLIYGSLASISFRPRVPSWIWIRWIQYATHRNNFT